MNRIKRARGTNSVMTGVFYLIAVFFFALLISFASYVIFKRIQRGDSGNVPLSEKRKYWKPVIQYDLSCIHITGIFRTAWSNCRNLSVYVCKKRIFDQVSSHLHRDTFLITIYRSRFVWISGIPCIFRTWKKSSCRSTFHFHTGNSSYYNDD